MDVIYEMLQLDERGVAFLPGTYHAFFAVLRCCFRRILVVRCGGWFMVVIGWHDGWALTVNAADSRAARRVRRGHHLALFDVGRDVSARRRWVAEDSEWYCCRLHHPQ